MRSHYTAHVVNGLATLSIAAGMAMAQATVDAELIAAEGDPAPGTPDLIITNLNAPFTDGNGKLGFTGAVDNGGSTDHFVWFDTGVIWLNSDAMPTVLSGAESTMGIGNLGEFIYSPSTDGNDSVWTHEGLLLKKTDPAPDFDGQFITFCSRPQGGPDGTAYFISGLNPEPGGSTQARVLYKSVEGVITKVLASGDVVEGFTIDIPSGIDFDYNFSDNGMHHISSLLMDTGSTTDDGFIYVDGTLVARETDPTGDGDNWDNLDSVSINDDGNYIFSGDTDGDPASDEFIAYNAVIGLRQGMTVDGVLLDSGSVQGLSLNNLGEVVHLWSTSSSGEVLFFGLAEALADSVVVLKENDLLDFDGDMIADAEVLDFNASGVVGPGISLAENGYISVEVDLLDLDSLVEYEAIVRVALPGPACPEDTNGDGVVDILDLLKVLADWGMTASPADVNDDGIVDILDLLAVLAAWGPC